jgi:hypothetical protein
VVHQHGKLGPSTSATAGARATAGGSSRHGGRRDSSASQGRGGKHRADAASSAVVAAEDVVASARTDVFAVASPGRWHPTESRPGGGKALSSTGGVTYTPPCKIHTVYIHNIICDVSYREEGEYNIQVAWSTAPRKRRRRRRRTSGWSVVACQPHREMPPWGVPVPAVSALSSTHICPRRWRILAAAAVTRRQHLPPRPGE